MVSRSRARAPPSKTWPMIPPPTVAATSNCSIAWSRLQTETWPAAEGPTRDGHPSLQGDASAPAGARPRSNGSRSTCRTRCSWLKAISARSAPGCSSPRRPARRDPSMAGRSSTRRSSTSRSGATSTCAPPTLPDLVAYLRSARPDRPRGPHRSDRQWRHPRVLRQRSRRSDRCLRDAADGGSAACYRTRSTSAAPAATSVPLVRTTAARSTPPSCAASARRKSTRSIGTIAASIDERWCEAVRREEALRALSATAGLHRAGARRVRRRRGIRDLGGDDRRRRRRSRDARGAAR